MKPKTELSNMEQALYDVKLGKRTDLKTFDDWFDLFKVSGNERCDFAIAAAYTSIDRYEEYLATKRCS